MSRLYSIAPNLWLSDTASFGDYNREVVADLLRSVDVNFSVALNIPPFSTCRCHIYYLDVNPMCCLDGDRGHIIFLHVTGSHWSQWLYQFAHEYCHHIINGTLEGELRGLMWFEETICELSSMWHLYMVSIQWFRSHRTTEAHFAPSHLSYLGGLLNEHPQLYADTAQSGFLSRWEQILSEPVYHRDYYNALAARMFPLFVANPHLWKIILKFGNMRRWSSLSDLFDHLRQTSEPGYRPALFELEKMLFY